MGRRWQHELLREAALQGRDGAGPTFDADGRPLPNDPVQFAEVARDDLAILLEQHDVLHQGHVLADETVHVRQVSHRIRELLLRFEQGVLGVEHGRSDLLFLVNEDLGQTGLALVRQLCVDHIEELLIFGNRAVVAAQRHVDSILSDVGQARLKLDERRRAMELSLKELAK